MKNSTVGHCPPPKISTIASLVSASSGLQRLWTNPRSTFTLRIRVCGCHSRIVRPQRLSVLRAMYPAYCHVSLEIWQTVTLVILHISSFLIQSRRETSLFSFMLLHSLYCSLDDISIFNYFKNSGEKHRKP